MKKWIKFLSEDILKLYLEVSTRVVISNGIVEGINRSLVIAWLSVGHSDRRVAGLGVGNARGVTVAWLHITIPLKKQGLKHSYRRSSTNQTTKVNELKRKQDNYFK